MVERLLGYALHQGGDAERARPHFARSLELAEGLSAQYEVALTLKAMLDTRYPDAEGLEERCGEILERLGVVSVPSPPLP
jgi:Flp pilus assembly protein TadD